MTNVPAIPPLLCSTPPPIDFGEDDEDDFDLPATDNALDGDVDDFGDFSEASGANNDDASLPRTPIVTASSNDFTELPPDLEDNFCYMPSIVTPPPLEGSTDKSQKSGLESKEVQPIEAINLEITSRFQIDNSEPNTMNKIDSSDNTKNSADDQKETKTIDNALPPLSLEANTNSIIDINTTKTLSSLNDDQIEIVSDEFVSLPKNPETTKEDIIVKDDENVTFKQYTTANSCMVRLEDIADDSSDDECRSPRKPKSLIVDDENAADFFVIHPVLAESNDEYSKDKKIQTDNKTKQENSVLDSKTDEKSLTNAQEIAEICEIPEDDFDEFASFERASPASNTKSELDSEPEAVSQPLSDEFAFDADFSQFSDFTSASGDQAPQADRMVVSDVITESIATSKQTEQANIDDDFDDFDDFQDFSAAVSNIEVQQQESKCAVPSMEKSNKVETTESIDKNYEDDDDDFGEFTEAALTSEPTASNQVNIINATSQLPIVTVSNLNERLKPILDMMFPTKQLENDDATSQNQHIVKTLAKRDYKLKLDSVDAARALDYQWSSSDVRHALIRSLGIDSRNILFGEKWNPSMPRFAANLSFNPLQPMKPTQQQPTTTASTTADNSATHSKAAAQQMMTNPNDNTYVLPRELPAVQFDWNTAGLVNPLDGSKEDGHPRKTEALYASQLGQSNATKIDDDQQQSKSYSTDAHNICDDANNASIDTASTSPTNAGRAATATLPANVPADSIGNNDIDISVCLETAVNNNNTKASSAEFAGAALVHTEKTTTFTALEADNSSNNNMNSLPLDDADDEVVTTSTYAGPLKETHIYTPARGAEGTLPKTTRAGSATASLKAAPIDFDYEIAAAGIIINETVVKKEYRDVEYNPGFGLEFSRTQKSEFIEEPAVAQSIVTTDVLALKETLTNNKLEAQQSSPDFDDEFSDFQSVPVPALLTPPTIAQTKAAIVTNNVRTATPTLADEMILSPAILLPQAIAMNNNSSKTKIEWGDAATSINPDELARIEELFPQPKSQNGSNNTKEANHSQRTTPTHIGQIRSQQLSSLSISATIAHKEQHANAMDDDDWSEFVSVPAAVKNNTTSQLNSNNNNQRLSVTQTASRQLSHSTTAPLTQKFKASVDVVSSTNANDNDEWSDFVSSQPTPAAPPPQFYAGTPQFNSAAWQNANFYNNPLSFYHQSSHTNNMSNQRAPQVKFQNNNNNNYSNNNNNLQQHMPNYQKQPAPTSTQHFQPQQIRIMQDFSTAAPQPNHYRPNVSSSPAHISQFQVGSAKVAPSISLIPDLGFVAPAVPAHHSFINSLPKPTFSSKK